MAWGNFNKHAVIYLETKMKRYLFIPILFFTINAWSAPTTTMSISPPATDGAVIEASDVNTRSSSISTPYNSHSHTDISQTGNTLSIGDGAAGNKTIEANNADVTKPFMRYDDINDRWVLSGGGSNVESIVTMTGATQGGYILKTSSSSDDLFVTRVYDDDGDTQIRVEASSDEDIIKMDTSGTERWIMTAAGERTMPTQSAFQALNNTDQSNIATGSAITILFQVETFDQAGNFASNTFTAPTTGRYQFNVLISIASIDQGATEYKITLNTSNRTYNYTVDPRQFAADIVGNWSINFGVLADMDSSDTSTVTFTQSGGAQQTDVVGGALFTGFLAL